MNASYSLQHLFTENEMDKTNIEQLKNKLRRYNKDSPDDLDYTLFKLMNKLIKLRYATWFVYRIQLVNANIMIIMIRDYDYNIKKFIGNIYCDDNKYHYKIKEQQLTIDNKLTFLKKYIKLKNDPTLDNNLCIFTQKAVLEKLNTDYAFWRITNYTIRNEISNETSNETSNEEQTEKIFIDVYIEDDIDSKFFEIQNEKIIYDCYDRLCYPNIIEHDFV